MAMRIGEVDVEAHYFEYGVEIVPGTILTCDDENDAKQHAEALGGKVFMRHVFETSWAEVE